MGNLVLAHLRKGRFPKCEYSKLKLKKIGPCKILRKFSANAHEIALPPDIEISLIFTIIICIPTEHLMMKGGMSKRIFNGRTNYL